MDIRRLGWAGIELASADTTIVIDFVRSFGSLGRFIEREAELPDPSRGTDAALVTHLHIDHTDPGAIASMLRDGGNVFGPRRPDDAELDPEAHAAALAEAEQGLVGHELPYEAFEPWDSRTVGPFTITALPAVDGFGDPQVSWLVEADGRRVFHCGDTLFHGSWWKIARRGGPIDVAFVPVNGAVCTFPHRMPASPFGADMDPVQAAAACRILGAGVAVPMHYHDIEIPGIYEEVDRPAEAFVDACAEHDVTVEVLAPGEALTAGLPGTGTPRTGRDGPRPPAASPAPAGS